MSHPKNIEEFKAAVLEQYPEFLEKQVYWHDDGGKCVPRFTCAVELCRYPGSQSGKVLYAIYYYPAFKAWERIRTYSSSESLNLYIETGKALSTVSQP